MRFVSEERAEKCMDCVYNLMKGIQKNTIVCFFPKCKKEELLPVSMKETRSETPDTK